jgi:hypothetical protein
MLRDLEVFAVRLSFDCLHCLSGPDRLDRQVELQEESSGPRFREQGSWMSFWCCWFTGCLPE